VGRIVDSARDQESIARANGKSVIQLRIAGRANADIVAVGAECKRAIANLLPGIPELSVEYTLDDTAFVQASVKNVIRDSIVGIALTALVIYLFLGRLPATFIVAVSMPIAFVSTFFPVQMHGFSLNLMTTLGLALSMGVLVDNAILVLENIYRYRDLGFQPFDAAEEGAAEISTAILAGVLTNLGVFLPIAMLSGIIGQLLVPYAVTILYATVFALWVTFTIVPSMAARLIKGGGASRAGKILTGWWGWLFEGLQDLFMMTLEKTLKRPLCTLFIFIILTMGAFRAAGGLGSENLPVSDDGTITVTLKLSNGVSITETEEKTIAVEEFIRSLPEAEYIGHVVSSIGASDTDQALNKSTISVSLKDTPYRPRTIDAANKIRSYLETMEALEFSVLAVRPGFGEDPISVHVKGDDMSVLFDIAERIRAGGNKVPGILDLSLSTEMGKPEFQISPIRWRLVQLGMDIADLTDIVRGYLNGNVVGTFRQGGSEFDIKVRLDPGKAGDIYAIGQLPVMTKYGAVPLEEMVSLRWSDSPTEIRRVERERTFMITGNVQRISIGEGIAKMRELIGALEIPPGYSARLAGEADDMEEESGEMSRAILMAIAVTFIVVASILESWVFAMIILLCVPVSAIGVIPLMFATGANISLFSMIGMIMLVGLVVNNAILVIDTAEQFRKKEGLAFEQAIQKACEIRFKPMVMCIATSVVSFMPLAFATGRGSEFRWPIAVVAIGGLIAGGFLSLLLIPSIYKIYWRARGWRNERISI
jgi:HAE1 family hydrophobic/amphiphilic exporter-1